MLPLLMHQRQRCYRAQASDAYSSPFSTAGDVGTGGSLPRAPVPRIPRLSPRGARWRCRHGCRRPPIGPVLPVHAWSGSGVRVAPWHGNEPRTVHRAGRCLFGRWLLAQRFHEVASGRLSGSATGAPRKDGCDRPPATGRARAAGGNAIVCSRATALAIDASVQ
jgi:hypothetical protein